jgi:ABC-type transport system involved in cytochrome c biogenesis ATPase subunit
LVDATIKLDQKTIAIVGPNEAGKTTLLRALAYAHGDDAMSPVQRSRSADVPDNTYTVSLRYLLDAADKAAMADLNLAEPPTEIRVSRRAEGGSVLIGVEPHPRKSESDLLSLISDLSIGLEGTPVLTKPVVDADEQVPADEQTSDDGADLLKDISVLAADLTAFSTAAVAVRLSIDRLREQADDLRERLREYDHVESIAAPLERVGEWVDRPNPFDDVINRLWNRAPNVLIFDEADRNLASSYSLDDALIAETPAALANLARLAGLNLAALHEANRTGQIARRDTLKNRANAALARYFASAWQQSDLKVELNVERNTLRVGLVEDAVYASVFDERSAGLRMFVALTAFLAARSGDKATVLLIDEAENHLHIDAQADLVEMFAQQDKADKIIYTTHSPACLPADLGVGIRAVVPDGDETSHVENSFWSQSGGAFTSLLFAMGASAAAFTPARCAVIAEGASDMILLPSLMRAALEQDKLPYQVAPGLSELPKDLYPDLDFEAAKVAFLVDGDAGGRDLAKALKIAVPADRIVAMAAPGIENVLQADQYVQTFVQLLGEANPHKLLPIPPTLPGLTEGSWAKLLEEWAKSEELRSPTKVEIANALIELENLAASAEGAEILIAAHRDLCRALGVSTT